MIRSETDLDTLLEITQLLSEPAGPRSLLEKILQILKTQWGVIRGKIVLAQAEGGQVVAQIPAAQHAPHGGPGLERDGHLVSVPILAGGGGGGGGTLTVELPGPGLDGPDLEPVKKTLAIIAGMIAGDQRGRLAAQRERQLLETENERLLGALQQQYRPESVIGNSRPMREVFLRIGQLSGSQIPLLIRGEAGTGKELVAAEIHYASPRAARPLVRVSCVGLGESTLENELFGHEQGGFSGAPWRRFGRIEEAEGGTLFLDEIGALSPALQVKLLRLIQDREYERAGGGQARPADVRLIAASCRNLEEMLNRGTLRQDFYYALGVFPIHLPPLRERRDDILLLANYFIEKHAARLGKAVRRISTPAINMLLAYHWPGNVRELENCIEHAILLATDDVIHGHTLPPTLQIPDGSEQTAGTTLKQQIHALERDMIVDSLKRSGGSITTASRELGITGRMVRYNIKQLGIDYRGMFSRRAASVPDVQ